MSTCLPQTVITMKFIQTEAFFSFFSPFFREIHNSFRFDHGNWFSPWLHSPVLELTHQHTRPNWDILGKNVAIWATPHSQPLRWQEGRWGKPIPMGSLHLLSPPVVKKGGEWNPMLLGSLCLLSLPFSWEMRKRGWAQSNTIWWLVPPL